MKFNYFLSLATLICFSAIKANAQQCQVALKAISGTYTGGCKKGKAEGIGESVGTDKYKGEFKFGLPDGKGVYTSANGDVFDGQWFKGQRDGKGIMNYKRAGKADSVVKGIWSRDEYAGIFNQAFVIYKKGSSMPSVDVRKNTLSNDRSITFNITSASAGMGRADGTTTGTGSADLSDVGVTKGSYEQLNDMTAGTRGTSKKLFGVVFPIKAVYRIGGQDLEMEITEPGDWTVTIAMNQ